VFGPGGVREHGAGGVFGAGGFSTVRGECTNRTAQRAAVRCALRTIISTVMTQELWNIAPC